MPALQYIALTWLHLAAAHLKMSFFGEKWLPYLIMYILILSDTILADYTME